MTNSPHTGGSVAKSENHSVSPTYAKTLADITELGYCGHCGLDLAGPYIMSTSGGPPVGRSSHQSHNRIRPPPISYLDHSHLP